MEKRIEREDIVLEGGRDDVKQSVTTYETKQSVLGDDVTVIQSNHFRFQNW